MVLYNIDDLKNVVDTNKELRNQDAEAAKFLIEEDIEALKERLRYLSMRPVMVRLHDKFDFLRERILAKTLRKPMININKAAGTEEEEHVKTDISRFFMLDDKDEDNPDDEKNYNYWN